MSMVALLSDQGTAVNPGLCGLHELDPVARNNLRKVVHQYQWQDVPDPFGQPFTDVSDNEAVYCYVCGNYSDGTDQGPFIEEVEFCGCTNEELEAGSTCGQPKCPNAPVDDGTTIFIDPYDTDDEARRKMGI
jgi:hypothetical protein